MNKDIRKKYQASDSPISRKTTETQLHGNDNVSNAYQELGELSHASPYDSIR
jgi:hypothetical protein